MQRNKQTMIRSHEELTTLTERILAQMGREGAVIRRRLQLFYRQRAVGQQTATQEAGQEAAVEPAGEGRVKTRI